MKKLILLVSIILGSLISKANDKPKETVNVKVSRLYIVDKSVIKVESERRQAIKKAYEADGYSFAGVKIIKDKCYLQFCK